MNPENEKFIERLMEEADHEFPSKGPTLDDCIELIIKLHDEKGLTFTEVAEWLSKKLGYKVARSSVYRSYQEWKNDPENLAEEMEAERQAEIADRKAR